MPTPETADAIGARLLDALAGLDLTSADGRAGIRTLLSEIERACPGAILQQAARIELQALGWPEAPRAQAASSSSRRTPGRGPSDSALPLHDAA